MSGGFSILPIETFQHVFFLLSREEKAKTGQVCKTWYNLINSQPQEIWKAEAAYRFQANQFIFPDIDISLSFQAQAGAVVSVDTNKESSKTLIEIIAQVHKTACTCKVFPGETMGLIADGLIALLNGEKKVDASFDFPGIEPFTKDFAVAGPKYLTMELGNQKSQIRIFAINAFKSLATFFITNEWKDQLEAKNFCFSHLKGLVAAYVDSCQYPSEVTQIISIFHCQLPLIQEFTCRMIPSQNKGILFDEIAKAVVKAPKPIIWKDSVICDDHRIYFKMMLADNMMQLLKLSRDEPNFQTNMIQILNLSCDSLKGLSLCSKEEFAEIRTPGRGNGDQTRYFGHLGGYLGQANYNYVLHNNQQATSTLRKAAVIYIIQGLESDTEAEKEHAMKILNSLFKDYFLAGKKGAANEHYLRAICEILRAYVDVEGNQDDMCQTVMNLFKKNVTEFKAFISFLPKGEEKDALDAIVTSLFPVVEVVEEEQVVEVEDDDTL